jgi:signal peptidase II
MRRFTRWLLLASVIVGCVGCDQVTKSIAGRELGGRPGVSLLRNSIHLSYAENTGGFLSLGAGWSEPLRSTFFLALASMLVAALLALAVVARSLDALQLLGLGLLVGGGTGNLIDRFSHGFARDWIVVGIGSLRTGVFNVADVAITVGVLVSLAAWVRVRAPEASRG